jgi:hypothetical protein
VRKLTIYIFVIRDGLWAGDWNNGEEKDQPFQEKLVRVMIFAASPRKGGSDADG